MVVLVTGASSGLGKYTAEMFARKGHTVYGTSRSKAAEAHMTGEIGIKMIELDVCDDKSCEAAVAKVIEREGRLDILINNAGMGIAGALELTSVEEAKTQFETNFFGVLRMCRNVLPIMRKQKFGRIINVSSVAASISIPFQALYSSGKSAVESISQALALEVAPYGIKVSAIEFGDMKTGFTSNRRITQESVADQQTNIYNEVFERSLKTMERDEQNGPEPLNAAKLIYRTALKNNPKPVIVCGAKYKVFVVLKRILPVRLSNYIIGKIYAK